MLKKIKRTFHSLFCGSLLGLTILSGPIVTDRLERIYIYDYKGSSVVMLTDNSGGGTGFVVEHEGKRYTLTNKHICKIAKEKGYLYYSAQNGSVGIVKVIKEFKDHDLCIMSDIPDLPALKISNDIEKHEKLWLVGHPGLRELTLENGYFVGDTTIRMWGTCPKEQNTHQLKALIQEIKKAKSIKELIELEEYLAKLLAGECIVPIKAAHLNNISYGGNSGSPVLNKWGNVVGVLFAGSPAHNTNSYMVPLRYIKQFLNEIGK